MMSVMEVTFSTMKQRDWWDERYLFPSWASTKALPNISPIQQTHVENSFGAAKVIKESILRLFCKRPSTRGEA